MEPGATDPDERARAAAALDEAIAACRQALRAALAARDQVKVQELQAHLAHLIQKKARA
ncbi:MAG: hypothetical protein AB7N76_00100 [Planctomycetota bacterium]